MLFYIVIDIFVNIKTTLDRNGMSVVFNIVYVG